MQSPTKPPAAERQDCATPGSPLAIRPAQTGSFEPTQLLYAGPWSKVYRVRPASGDDAEAGQYAMKVPSRADETATDDAIVAEKMIRHEARVMHAVSQANVISLLGARLRSAPYYLLLPFLEGATLGDVFAAGLRLPLPHALWLARQIAQGLQALHGAGWLHADIKPQNIHVAPWGHATLLDLGLARRIGEVETRVDHAAITGTLIYAAPEQFRPSATIDQRSDLYSLGVVLHQMLAGSPPFVKPNAASLIAAHLDQPPPALPLREGRIAAEVRELAARLLAKDPLRRPQTARELAARLCRLEIAAMRDVAAAA